MADRQSNPSQASQEKKFVFISHYTEESYLAERFRELLLRSSGDMLEGFHSSSRNENMGISAGDIWYPKIIDRLNQAAAVVALLTKRSIGRPWVYYEAGIAAANRQQKVIGLALGIPVKLVNYGPFSPFKNCAGDEKSLIDLVHDLVEQYCPNTKPSIELTRPAVKHFLREAGRFLERGEWGDMEPAQFLGYLRKNIPLRYETFAQRKFSKSKNSIVRAFMGHHWKSYSSALHLTQQEILPLPSRQRREVAEMEIEKTKKGAHIMAVSILADDRWHSESDSSYLDANIRAAIRGVKIRRVLILKHEWSALRPETIQTIERQRTHGIDLKYCTQERAKEFYKDEDSMVNLAIINGRTMTRSTPNTDHEGVLVTDPLEIMTEIDRFRRLWRWSGLSEVPVT